MVMMCVVCLLVILLSIMVNNNLSAVFGLQREAFGTKIYSNPGLLSFVSEDQRLKVVEYCLEDYKIALNT